MILPSMILPVLGWSIRQTQIGKLFLRLDFALIDDLAVVSNLLDFDRIIVDFNAGERGFSRLGVFLIQSLKGPVEQRVGPALGEKLLGRGCQ